ncbi:zonular occludens toxin domain-containing protein [Pseudomonas sp. CGJS7]|uniref:zonular occludens toxin domain-containing protein n=1 Tax=Pseudomonas sp. CGJS7 TaxID=3109348 RepID=UPI003008A99C
MMTLITGQPGHGKSAYGLLLALDFKKKGREVYAHGIPGLDYEATGFHRIENPKNWHNEVPHGSVIFIDECYSTFPNRNPASAVPAHVDEMARHRHNAYDFILVAQQGLQIDPFLRGLYDEHIHIKKKFGKYSKRLRWNSYQGNVKAMCSDATDWIRPNHVFKYYKSTELDTSRLHVPKWLQWIVVLLLVLGGLAYYLKHGYDKKIAQYTSENSAANTATSASAPPATSRGERVGAGGALDPKFATATDYAKAHLPRFATMPWTAPVYDQRPATADPQLLCMSTEAGADAAGDHVEASCTCLTEQGTRYDISQGECRRIARDGPVYNPYRQLSQEAPRLAHQDAAATGGVGGSPPTQNASYGAVLAGQQVSGYGDIGVGAKADPAP